MASRNGSSERHHLRRCDGINTIAWSSILWVWVSGLVFAVSHSLLASQTCKQWSHGHGLKEPYYRLLYSVFAIVTTGVWSVFVHQLPDSAMYQTDGIVKGLLVSAQLLGVIVALAAFQPIDGLVFLGLRKARADKEPFIERGVYRYVRHPMYAGAMLILLSMPEQTWNGLHFALVVCIYFIMGSRFEEARMLSQHHEYAAYRLRVPAFIPHLACTIHKSP